MLVWKTYFGTAPNNHVVTTEIPHTVFLVFENDDISRMVFHSADSPGAMDRAIRSWSRKR